jgi:DNA-binding LacI/PurR family transcriptional regulator
MVSLKDVAQACGVSVATASKALNGHSDVSAVTAKRVKEAAQSMGYLPNTAARALKTHRTNNIAVLFSDEAQSGLTHSYFSNVLEGVRTAAQEKDYDITFISNNQVQRKMSYYERCRSRGVDGIVVACVNFDSPQIREIVSGDIPTVTIDHIFSNCTAIISDNVNGMKDLVEYAIEQGHRKIAYIHGKPSSVTQDRLASFYRTLYEHNIQVPEQFVLEADYLDGAAAQACTRKLLGMRDHPTCILYPDDMSCIGGMNAIMSMGLRIPEDISVIGYDGQQVSSILRPALTTLRQDTRTIGASAAQKLISMIEQPKAAVVERIVVKGELVKGRSVKHLPD